MRIVRTKSELVALAEPKFGFVPTMGAFHEGHLSLMRRAKSERGGCSVSLFVNPTQFGPQEDLSRYPRQEALDFEMAESAGVDLIFAPSAEEMYARHDLSVKVGAIGELWEGASRPGHFDGVATVVAKLFGLFRPEAAYFGLKDFQQCAVLRQLVEGLDYQIRLRFCETVREPDGLAMSSRNAYLNSEERRQAPKLFAMLQSASEELRSKRSLADAVIESGIHELEQAGFRVDYLAWVDGSTLSSIREYQADSRLIAAAYMGKTRLIDNCEV